MTDYVVMPKEDYLDALTATREKTGKSALLRSGELGAAIRSISGSDASSGSSGDTGDDTTNTDDLSAVLSEQEATILSIGEKLGALVPTLTLSFATEYCDYDTGDMCTESVTASGRYVLDDGTVVSFENAETVEIGFVPLGGSVKVSADNLSLSYYTSLSGCSVDTYEFEVGGETYYGVIVTVTEEPATAELLEVY